METSEILYVLCSAFFAMFMYWRGVVSGYHTKIREKHKSQVLTIQICKEKNQYLFYDMADNSFMTQSTDLEATVEKIKKDILGTRTLVIIADKSVEDEDDTI